MAAAKATCSMASVRTLGSTLMAMPDSTVGIGGKSPGSAPLMWASNLAQSSARLSGCSEVTASILSSGRELTNSVKSRAGTVIDPSSSTCAPIQVLMAISRLVAASLSRLSSVDIRTFWIIGSVVLVATGPAHNGQPFAHVLLETGHAHGRVLLTG